MNFDELHELVPYARFGKEKSLTMEPYPGIILAMPGRHAEDCSPRGGDFVVMVSDRSMKWRKHQFKHSDLFNDVQVKYDNNAITVDHLLQSYLKVICGADPDTVPITGSMLGINQETFLRAVQCLAVAEHRRYAQYEDKFGGRYLPFRFAAGIAEGLWTADAGTEVQKYGRPAVERLEKKNGTPKLTLQLMSTTP